MNIQVISYNAEPIFGKMYPIKYSTFGEPMSLDMYDVNIILLQDEDIWTNDGLSTETLNVIKDLNSLRVMIQMSTGATNIICYPLNILFRYSYDSLRGVFEHSYKLKDNIFTFIEMISKVSGYKIKIAYENVKTICGKTVFDAAFYFPEQHLGALTFSDKSSKNTTIAVKDNLILTTLDISSKPMGLKDLLKAIGVDETESSMPEWLNDVTFYNDEEQNEIILDNNQQIEELKKQIVEAQELLDKNMRYKSILSTNGDELVEVVFDILEQIMDYDLSDFEDEKKEDFIIKLSKITFVGEIKGISSNIKSEHISQLEVHCQGYMDYLQEKNIVEEVKALLIINPFKTKPLSERSDVHQTQIALAEKYGSLIITTDVLLRIFELYLSGDIDNEKIIQILKTKIGLLRIEDLSVD